MSCGRKIGPYNCCSVVCGDCLSLMAALPDGCVDAVITDPPYGVGLVGKTAKQRGGGQTIRPGEYGHPDTRAYILKVVIPAIEQCLRISRTVAVTPGARSAFLYPEPTDIGCFFSAAGTGMGRWGFTCSQPILFYGSDPYLEHSLGPRPNSFGQTYPNDANEIDHPCAKPMRQWKWLVGRASLEGYTILDPFLGSGTTAVAAKKLGRHFLGFEISEEYCRIARERIALVEAQPSLFEPQPTQPRLL